MPVLELMASSGLGSLLGMRHALEPDHLAAVSTLVTGERSSRKAAFLGACWGLGHTVALIAAGTGFVVLRAQMPAQVASALEFAVAVMLVGLGLRAIHLARRQGAVATARASTSTTGPRRTSTLARGRWRGGPS
jgi:high-affinity nickel permease